MSHIIYGKCHCGNLSFELSTNIETSKIQTRACDCRFCRLHGAKNWSDPDGSILIQVNKEPQLQRYRFGSKTADFYICRICGTYLGAVLADADGTWSTVNLRLTDLATADRIVSYGSEEAAERVARRKRVWTPTTLVEGA